MSTEMPATPPTTATTIIEHEAEQVEHANASGRTPVVFIHGLFRPAPRLGGPE